MRKIILMLTLISVFGFQSVFAQTTVTGTVTSADDGSTLPGVSVVIQGTSLGTTTDMDGKFVLSVPDGTTAIIFSFVGMESQTIAFSGQKVINVSLNSSALALEEVIVMGYITRGKNELTGSTVQVTGDQISKVPVVSADQALQGKVAGLTISQASGTPGSIQDIRIRGVGSITAGNDPLIVIDGVPVVNDDFGGDAASSSLSALSAINSNDIETITVLKDASATSAYGARGSNGVIVISTKKGKAGVTKFNFSSSYGFQNNATEGLKPLTGDQRAELLLEGIYNTYGATYDFTKEGAYDFMVDNNLDYGDLQNWDGVDGNWAEEVTNEDAPVLNISFSARGGDEKSTFYASFGYNKTEATVIGSDFKRINGQLNYTRNFRKNLKFSTSNSISNTFQNAFLETSAYFGNPHLTKYFMSPWEHPYNADGTLNINLNTSVFNTIYLAENNIKTNDLTRGISNSFVEWEIIPKLKFKSLIALDYNIAAYKGYNNRLHGDSEGENGSSEASTERNFNYVIQNSLDYSLNYNDHSIQAKALIEYQKNKNFYLYGYGENFPADGLTNIANAGANDDAYSSFGDWSNLSYLGMVNYNYQGKYIVDLTFRREGSSRFASDLRFGNFGSAGAAWNIKQESFLKDIEFINTLRIRGSFGYSGSSSISTNSFQALLAYDADYASQGAIYPSQFGNASLTWEKNRNYDIGADFAFLNNRISGSVAYYNKFTYDLLQAVPLSLTTGHSSQNQNIGEVLNTGIELELTGEIIRTKDLNWSISGNFATVNNEVLALAKDGNGDDINIQTGTRKVEVGQPIYAWFMRKWAGVDPDNGEALWYLNGVDGETTNAYYDAEEAFQGESAIPKYSGGLSTHVDFKGFYVDASFYFAGGHKVYEDWSFYTHHSGIYTTLYYQGVVTMMDRWQEPGDITDVPKVIYGTNNDSRTSSRFLYDGDYVRLKDLVFGYDIPKSALANIGFESASIYVRGSNLFTWVKDDRLAYDPEVRADGFTRLTTPPVKSIVFGINLNF